MTTCCRTSLVILLALIAHAVRPIAVNAQQPKAKDRVEQSVDSALAYLAAAQETDGSWSANGQRSPGVSGLAVMAFQAAGHVPGEGPYQANIDKGVRWILAKQRPDGLIGDFGLEMYHHGICTLCLTQVVGMTDKTLGDQVRPKLEKAVQLLLKAQRTEGTYRGGWRYRPDSLDADMSVTGWQLLALRAARNVGCDVPAERIERATEFVLRCRDPQSGGFGYLPGIGNPTVACTGTSVLALELCGKDRHRSREVLQAGSYLLKHPFRWGDMHTCYTAYYTSQAMFQLGGNYWAHFRPQLHKTVLDNQQRDGSWQSTEGFGPAYATAMAVLALTVEYRFLPIYQRDEGPPPKE